MARITRLATQAFSQPFAWGSSDCCLAVADVLVALGRADPAASYRGTYHDEAGAQAALGGDVAAMMDREAVRLGWPEIAPRDALPGDVGLCIGGPMTAPCLALKTETYWMAKGQRGCVVFFGALRAWRTA